MDKTHQTLANEAFAHIEVKRLREARKKIEREPKPSAVDLSGWVKEMEASLKGQMVTSAKSVVHKSGTEIESMFQADLLKTKVVDVFHKNLSNEIAAPLLLQYLPVLQKEMEAVLFDREMAGFNSRFEGIDGRIRQWEAKIPKVFSLDQINVSDRYPISRVGFLQERAFDRWLSDALKSKPIFFDSPDYIEKLTLFYETVYKPMAEAEQKAKEPEKEPLPVEEVTLAEEKDRKPVLPTEDERTDLTKFANRHPRFQA